MDASLFVRDQFRRRLDDCESSAGFAGEFGGVQAEKLATPPVAGAALLLDRGKPILPQDGAEVARRLLGKGICLDAVVGVVSSVAGKASCWGDEPRRDERMHLVYRQACAAHERRMTFKRRHVNRKRSRRTRIALQVSRFDLKYSSFLRGAEPMKGQGALPDCIKQRRHRPARTAVGSREGDYRWASFFPKRSAQWFSQ